MSRKVSLASFNDASLVDIVSGPGKEAASVILEMVCSKSCRTSEHRQILRAPMRIALSSPSDLQIHPSSLPLAHCHVLLACNCAIVYQHP